MLGRGDGMKVQDVGQKVCHESLRVTVWPERRLGVSLMGRGRRDRLGLEGL